MSLDRVVGEGTEVFGKLNGKSMIRIGIGTFIESNQNFDMLDFEERGNPGEPHGDKNQ